MKVYTIGYEKRDLRQFIEKLQSNGIERVIDVREMPFSRRKEFSKNNIEKALKKAGIEYVSFRELGAPKEIRKKLKENAISFEKFSEEYRNHIVNGNDFLKLKVLVSERLSTLMCYEADPRKCHRSILAEMLEKEGFEVIHI